MKAPINTANFRYGCKILLHCTTHIAAEPELKHFWDGYSYECFNKWQWYFRYRQALLQVQYPKRYVELVTFNYEYIAPKEQQLKRLKDKLTSAKALHTSWMRKMELAKEHWNEIFPIEEHPDYIRAMAKVQQKQALAIELENKIAVLK